jgi:hypothetical protein
MENILDTFKDPGKHWADEPKNMMISHFLIEMPLNDIVIKYYDWFDGSEITYDELETKYPDKPYKSRFRCIFNKLDGKIDLDFAALLVKSVNIWKSENIIQIKIIQLVDTDYSLFFPFMRLSPILSKPDLILSY